MQISEKTKKIYLYNSNMLNEVTFPFINYNNTSKNVDKVMKHYNALQYVLKNYKKQLIEKHILNVYKFFSNDIFINEYRTVDIFDRGVAGIKPHLIRKEIKKLLNEVKVIKTNKQCWDFHYEFGSILPFYNDNWKIARLLLNWLSLRGGFGFQIIKFKDEQIYENQIILHRLNKKFLKNDFWVDQ